MATGAIQALPVVDHCRLGPKICRLLVAVETRNRDVPSSQYEVRLFVFGERKCGWRVSLKIVAAVASVEVRRGGELPGVTVAVAIGTALKLDLEQCVLALGNMALVTAHACMSAL